MLCSALWFQSIIKFTLLPYFIINESSNCAGRPFVAFHPIRSFFPIRRNSPLITEKKTDALTITQRTVTDWLDRRVDYGGVQAASSLIDGKLIDKGGFKWHDNWITPSSSSSRDDEDEEGDVDVVIISWVCVCLLIITGCLCDIITGGLLWLLSFGIFLHKITLLHPPAPPSPQVQSQSC